MKKNKTDLVPMENLRTLEDNYYDSIDSDPRFSTEVDPTNRYHFSEAQKEFIAYYAQFKNIPLAAKLANIDEDLAISYYNTYNVKMEIRRINLALNHRAFATRMMNIDELGGYLTSLIIGDNVAEADKIGTRDKLQAAKMIMELNKMKQEGISDPDKIIDAVDIQEDLSSLSVDTIQKLLESTKKKDGNRERKEELIEEINDINNGLSAEEINHLKTLPTSELLNILEETNKVIEEKKDKKEEIEEDSDDSIDILKNKIMSLRGEN